VLQVRVLLDQQLHALLKAGDRLQRRGTDCQIVYILAYQKSQFGYVGMENVGIFYGHSVHFIIHGVRNSQIQDFDVM
jgi:hypothetical protein